MRAEPGFGRALLAFATLAALLASGCASPLGREEASSTTTIQLGAPAVVDPDITAPPSSDGTPEEGESGSTGPPRDDGGDDPATPREQTPPAAPSTQPARNYTEKARGSDRAGDHGSAARGYADLVGLVADSSDDFVRLSVLLKDQPPVALATSEVMGIGIDVYDGPLALDSSHQLFADGGSDGWTGYFEAAGERVPYPGSLTVGRNRLIFEVPWAALGGKREVHLRVFADWSNGSGAFGEDFLPDIGKVVLRP